MLATAWAAAGQTEAVLLQTRTRARADALATDYPGRMTVHDDVLELAAQSDALLICTKAPEASDIVRHIAPRLRPEQFVALTNSTTPLAWLEKETPSHCAKIIPSLTQYARAGVILVMPGDRLSGAGETGPFYELLAQIGKPYLISEQQVRIYSDLTSCGPAFLASIMLDMVQGARERGVSREAAEYLLGEMLLGLGVLVTQGGFSWEDIVARVSVPGGVTLAGLGVLRREMDGLFDRVFAATEAHQKKSHSSGGGLGETE